MKHNLKTLAYIGFTLLFISSAHAYARTQARALKNTEVTTGALKNTNVTFVVNNYTDNDYILDITNYDGINISSDNNSDLLCSDNFHSFLLVKGKMLENKSAKYHFNVFSTGKSNDDFSVKCFPIPEKCASKDKASFNKHLTEPAALKSHIQKINLRNSSDFYAELEGSKNSDRLSLSYNSWDNTVKLKIFNDKSKIFV